MRQILVIANETVESDVLRNLLPQSARVLSTSMLEEAA